MMIQFCYTKLAYKNYDIAKRFLDNKKTEIGYWISKENEGRGIISKTIKVLIEYAFNDLGLNKIEIGVAVPNVRNDLWHEI